MKVDKEFINNFLADLNRNRLVLPTLPEVAVQVRKLVNDPNSTDRQISRLISTDPALTARLLQVVNSPLHRSQEKIDNLQTAVTRLGVAQVRNLVTALVMQQLYQAKGTQLTRQRLKTLWSHSAKVATFSYVLARRFTKLQPDQALLGGLIHDIGVLPILRHAEKYPELANDPEALEEVIKRLHTIIGPLILDEWSFSPELAAVTSQHEDLWRSEGAEVSYVDVVVVANLHSYLGTQHYLVQKDWSDIPAFTKLGLTPEETIKTLEEVREELQELRSLFN